MAGTWQRLPPLPAGTAVLLFGICTAWRSNDRVPAAQHRVADEPALLAGAAGVTPRRLSAVLFMGKLGGRAGKPRGKMARPLMHRLVAACAAAD